MCAQMPSAAQGDFQHSLWGGPFTSGSLEKIPGSGPKEGVAELSGNEDATDQLWPLALV